MPASGERDDRNTHVERLQRAVGIAERHRIEHQADDVVTRPVLCLVAPLRHQTHARMLDAGCREEPSVDRTVLGGARRHGENSVGNTLQDLAPQRKATP